MTRKTREVAIFVYRGDLFLIARRVPQGVWNVIAGQVEDGESFSAAAARLIQQGASGPKKAPRYVASGDGPPDLGRLAERYLREPIAAR